MQRIGVMTSGGDAPGMNANVRAVVRTGVSRGVQVFGIRDGFAGLISDEIIPMTSPSVGGIIGKGGTILGTARCEEFRDPAGRAKAAQTLRKHGIEGIVVCGGDGSFRGAHLLWKEHNIPVICTPGTIDNDLAGTDYTIGFDTAVNTALEAIDRIRDTAEAHRRTFIVEVMGRHSGFIALATGIGGGADAVLVPEIPPDIPRIISMVERRFAAGKRFSLIVVAEGVVIDDFPGAGSVAHILKKHGLDCRVSIIGHQQRGGAPTALDREFASLLGKEAVEELLRGGTDKMAGIVGKRVEFCDLEYSWREKKPIDMEVYRFISGAAI